MKLSKVTRVLDLFEADPEEYRIHKLDPNRVPDTKFYRDGDIEHRCQVSLLKNDKSIENLPQGVSTAQYIEDSDLVAVHVEFHRLKDNKTTKYEKMLLIK